MEQKIGFYQADLIEMADENLTYLIEGWIFKHGKDIPEDVKNFIAWCRAEHKEQMHCKRGKDGKSFAERRDESKAEIKRKYDEYMNRGRK